MEYPVFCLLVGLQCIVSHTGNNHTKGPATRNDFVNDIVNDARADAIFASLKAIVDDIVDDIVTCGMAFSVLFYSTINKLCVMLTEEPS